MIITAYYGKHRFIQGQLHMECIDNRVHLV